MMGVEVRARAGWSVAVFAVVVGAAVTGCGDFSAGDIECFRDDECDSGFVCEARMCVAAGADTADDTGAATEADVEADTGADTGPVDAGGDATSDATPDARADADATDVADESLPDASDLGSACSSGTTCDSGFCGNGRCAPEGFSYIAPGTFTMGSLTSEVGRFSDETQHSVTLTRAFYMQQTEVTQGRWRARMGNNPSNFTGCGDSCPVETVNWYEALAYANALSDAEGLARCYTLSGCSNTAGNDMECSSVSVTAAGGNPLLCEGYRLPTESEWEYAARAGTTTATYRGNLQEPTGCDPQPNLEPIAWYCENAGSTTHAVSTRAANNWGLYDMLGNVLEWCWDWYGTYPGTATDPLGAASGSTRVLRGGSWDFSAQFARAAVRSFNSPGIRIGNRGFRLARSAP